MFFSRHRQRTALALTASVALAIGQMVARPDLAEAGPSVGGTSGADMTESLHRGMVLIPAGIYLPLIRTKDEPENVAVAAFWLDERAVTNAEFLAFVRANPQWRRSAVSPLFADTEYLSHWAGDLELGSGALAHAPVVRVSWFAARAFARVLGKRLPSTAEWERAASAGYTSVNGASESGFAASVLAWFTRPSPEILPDAGTGRANFFGARNLFGLVWEWVDDFNTAMVTGESRADTGLERDLFCGAGAAGVRDPSDYAAFMRAGFRSSLRANYAVPNLGFRCAADSAAAVHSAAGSSRRPAVAVRQMSRGETAASKF